MLVRHGGVSSSEQNKNGISTSEPDQLKHDNTKHEQNISPILSDYTAVNVNCVCYFILFVSKLPE